MTTLEQNSWNLNRGEIQSRKELHKKYGGVRQGGISPSSKSSNIFLFTDDAANKASGYLRNRWISEDLFLYCGEGQGDKNQTLDRYNGSIIRHRQDGKALRLFLGSRGDVTYVGEFKLDESEPHFWTRAATAPGATRRIVMFRLRPVGFTGPGSSGDDEHLIDLTSKIESNSPSLQKISEPYRFANESINTALGTPFAVDPDIVDRSLQMHAFTQNLLAEWIQSDGLIPESPSMGAPAFDLAWRGRARSFVAEVKSLSSQNEVGQLRLGIGQVLDYAEQLGWNPVLAVERRPTSDRWLQLCRRIGVTLLWPARFTEITPRDLERGTH